MPKGKMSAHRSSSSDNSPVANINAAASHNAACAITSAAKSYTIKSRSSPGMVAVSGGRSPCYLQKKTPMRPWVISKKIKPHVEQRRLVEAQGRKCLLAGLERKGVG